MTINFTGERFVPGAAGENYRWHWRVDAGLWAAAMASKLQGDFIECGVNRGFMSSAIMELLDWNRLGRSFYLLDTFTGIDDRYLSHEDVDVGVLDKNKQDIGRGFYTFDLEAVRRNFSEWDRVKMVIGSIPETLPQIDSTRIAFVHLDLNCSLPEVAAMEYMWDSLVLGAIVLMDDYAYIGYRSQKLGMDRFAAAKGVPILSLPTGQGLLIKPCMLLIERKT